AAAPRTVKRTKNPTTPARRRARTRNCRRVRIEASLETCTCEVEQRCRSEGPESCGDIGAAAATVSTTNRAALQENLRDSPCVRDVFERIPVQHDEIGLFSRAEHAGVAQPQVVSAAARRR